MQLLFWFNIASLFPVINLGVPFGPAIVHGNANTIVTTFAAVLLGLGLNEGAYMAEIVRAGFLSVPEGQTEAAQSLGMSRLQIMRLVVLPQAMRVIIPPTGNETISMLKNTSLASVITYVELIVRRPVDLLGELQDDPAPDRDQHLVPRADERPVRRSVLHRAPLRAWLHARRASDHAGAVARHRPRQADGAGDERGSWSRPRASTSASGASRC